MLSPFDEKQKRATVGLAAARNQFVVSIADEVLIAYAHPGSKTEALCREVLASGKRVTDVDSNTPVAGKKTETLKVIAARVGLSFQQFRRAVLLAQGDFDAFVRSNAKERAELTAGVV